MLISLGLPLAAESAGLLNHPVAQEKAGLLTQLLQQRPDLGNQATRFRFDQHAHHTHGLQSETAGHAPTFPLIHQHPTRLALHRQGDGFRFARIEPFPQGRDQGMIGHPSPRDPVRAGDLMATRPSMTTGVQLRPNRLGDQQAAVQCPQYIELADSGEIGQRRGVADDHRHDRRPSVRKVSISSCRSSES